MNTPVTWLVEFYEISDQVGPKGEPLAGVLIERVEVRRVQTPTRWARSHVLDLRRQRQGKPVTFHIIA